MIEANRDLFLGLEKYCQLRGEPLESPGRRRYVRSCDEEKRLLQGLKAGTCLRFGNHRSLTHLFIGEEHYIGLVGFEFDPLASDLQVVDNNAGYVICILEASKTSPSASPPNVRNVVEAGSMGETGYSGHDSRAIESLFPSIRVLQLDEPPDSDSVWRLYLQICAGECMQGGSWIEDQVATGLATLTALDIPSMPYSAICRSIFDADPRSLFMALYRCIEATYAYESSRQLIDKLELNIAWQEMAAALETEIGWHPQEAANLNLVLRYTVESNLIDICDCLNVDVGKDAQAVAGRAIYALRNSIVHFRPGTKEVKVDDIDWNRLCHLLIEVVFDVFTRAYV